MADAKVEVNFFGPRYGREDNYEFVFSKDSLTIGRAGLVKITVTWVVGADPSWSGSLNKVLINDGIYPPVRFESLIEHLWAEWREGGIPDDELHNELKALVDYVNVSTKAKPKTEFWSRTF